MPAAAESHDAHVTLYAHKNRACHIPAAPALSHSAPPHPPHNRTGTHDTHDAAMRTRRGRYSLRAVTLMLCLGILLLPPADAQQSGPGSMEAVPLEDGSGGTLMHVPSHGADNDDQGTPSSPCRSTSAPAVAAAAGGKGEAGSPPHRRLKAPLGDGVFTLLMSSNANYLRINMPKDGLL